MLILLATLETREGGLQEEFEDWEKPLLVGGVED